MLQQGAKATGDNWRDNWQTPQYILDLVDQFFPTGWLDPAPAYGESNAFDITKSPMPMYINPPFSQYAKFVDHLLGRAPEQVWICHTNSDTKWFHKLLRASSVMVLTDHRVRFIDPRTGRAGDKPRQGQTLFYIGSRDDVFCSVFAPLGSPINLRWGKR